MKMSGFGSSPLLQLFSFMNIEASLKNVISKLSSLLAALNVIPLRSNSYFCALKGFIIDKRIFLRQSVRHLSVKIVIFLSHYLCLNGSSQLLREVVLFFTLQNLERIFFCSNTEQFIQTFTAKIISKRKNIYL